MIVTCGRTLCAAHVKRTKLAWHLDEFFFRSCFRFTVGDHMLRYRTEWHRKRLVRIGWIGKPLLMLFDSIKNLNSRLHDRLVSCWTYGSLSLADDVLRVVTTRCIIIWKIRMKNYQSNNRKHTIFILEFVIAARNNFRFALCVRN